MRISDWSSDVCSSDLMRKELPRNGWCPRLVDPPCRYRNSDIRARGQWYACANPPASNRRFTMSQHIKHNSSGDRKSVVWGKSVSVRVDLGGRRIIKTKRTKRRIRREYEDSTSK